MKRHVKDVTFKLVLGGVLALHLPTMAQTVPATVLASDAAAVRTASPPPDLFGTLTFTAENDLFGGSTDRYYSNGVLLTWRSPSANLPAPFAGIDDRLTALFGPGTLRWGVSLGQNIYTPGDKYRSIPDPRDRPYAGHLYAAFSLGRYTGATQTLFELQAGVVGPSALGEGVVQSAPFLGYTRRAETVGL